MQVHTIGDSHSIAGWESISNIFIHHLGPILAYSFGRDGLSRNNIKNSIGCMNDTVSASRVFSNINENDIVIFCFGEIDCRGHVHKHITPDKSYKVVIDEIITKYFESIDANVRQFNKLHVCVYNVVPSIEKEKTAIELQQKHPEWPFLGTNEERCSYVHYFNMRAGEECAKRNYTFIDLFDKYADENGFLNGALSDGLTHIKSTEPLMEFMNDYFDKLVYSLTSSPKST